MKNIIINTMKNIKKNIKKNIIERPIRMIYIIIFEISLIIYMYLYIIDNWDINKFFIPLIILSFIIIITLINLVAFKFKE